MKSIRESSKIPNSRLFFSDSKWHEKVGDFHSESFPIKSMMIDEEIDYLYFLTKYVYKNKGLIVDLGPLAGASTFALASGLDTSLPRKKMIYSYDLFSFYPDWSNFFVNSNMKEGDDFHDLYKKNLLPFEEIVFSEKSDLASTIWSQDPIELIFIDAAKSIPIFNNIINQFFPNLSPGSIVIQQDFVSAEAWWIHLFHGVYEDYFEMMESPEGGTVAFRLLKPFYDKRIDFLLMHPTRIIRIYEKLILGFPKWHSLCIRLALVNCLMSYNEIELAKYHLALVQADSLLQPAVYFDLDLVIEKIERIS